MKKIVVLLLLILIPVRTLALVKGDVNGDNKVGSSDYILVKKHILGKSTLTGDKATRADVDENGKVGASDYLTIKKIILGTYKEINQKKVTVSFVGGSIVKTGYEGNEVLIKGGKVSVHTSLQNNVKLSLKKGQKYAVSFDYYTISGTNKFDIDIYPDKISQTYPKTRNTIQVNLTATKTSQHYDWVFSSNDSKIEGADVALRFFDDIRSGSESDVVINNIVMSKVTSKTYNEGDLLENLSTPTRTGYKFLGWYTSPTGGTKVTKSTKVTEDLTLYARWSGTYEHVFIIGIDGLGDTFGTKGKYVNNNVNPVNFNRIFSNYAYRHNAKTETNTWSAPNWTSIFSGVTWETHGIDNDTARSSIRTSLSGNQTVFYYIKKAMHNALLTSIVNWNPINTGIIESDIGIEKDHNGEDDNVVTKVTKYLKKHQSNVPTLMFIHLESVDNMAHKMSGKCETCGGYSKEYFEKAQAADTMLGTIYDAINNLGIMDNSLVILVTDHGNTKNSHGNAVKNRDAKEESAVVAVRGYSVNKMKLPETVHNRDVSAIVLYALGIDKPEHFVSVVPSGLFNK